MTSTKTSFLPTEILSEIVEYLYVLGIHDDLTKDNVPDRALLQRQASLANFCLVNRQWYSAGIEYLYREPEVSQGNRFLQFTETLCPPPKTRQKTITNLKSMVRTLDLAKLVHQSSNSTTARLISKTSKNLTWFRAPRVSFSLNGLASLTKCQNLRRLDLSRVGDSSITFPQLKKTVSKLGNLNDLSLPIYIPLTPTFLPNITWPNSLHELTIGGIIDHDLMQIFDWPTNLGTLRLSNCKNLDIYLIESILDNEFMSENLHNFTINTNCMEHYMHLDDSTAVLHSLDLLERLDIPSSLLRPLLLLDDEMSPIHLTIMVIDDEPAMTVNDSEFGADLMKSLESGPLGKIWALYVSRGFSDSYQLKPEEIDDLILLHLDDVDDEELDEWGTRLGFYEDE
ncbi:hypothetical protein N7466_009172 [Penicillium verhagenii]|uniref:uncharacterized protein n=1 Tax=Penicillium verhagenii TaxID=1562060 RepID=UPI00254581A2|nr:uncharacterized protein N7466_009172 [Penicillium verhagenii]KAJ5920846.1 hypothetical protein N7466_009172 [Penicillium verhagenii]